MSRCYGCLQICCSDSRTYQPLSIESIRGSSRVFTSDQEKNKPPKNQTCKLSVRHDVIRTAQKEER